MCSTPRNNNAISAAAVPRVHAAGSIRDSHETVGIRSRYGVDAATIIVLRAPSSSAGHRVPQRQVAAVAAAVVARDDKTRGANRRRDQRAVGDRRLWSSGCREVGHIDTHEWSLQYT